LSTIIGSLKSASSRLINALRGTPGEPVWQRGFYDHVVRNEDDLARIRDYILTNPLRWSFDEENPAAAQRA
jgi:REP element-mobilizing transposase RayT